MYLNHGARRYDLFEDDFCQSLDRLTNSAPCHSFEDTRQIVEDSLQQPIEALFSEFNEKALASGSIGQVHIAKWIKDGSTVAVKVQHPNLADKMALDMAILRQIAVYAAWLAPDMRIDETMNQFASNFECQLNFIDEAHNLIEFAQNFGSTFWQATVSFPVPILASHDVLVETFEPGESVATFLVRAGDRSTEGAEWVREADGSWTLAGLEETEDDVLRKKVAFCGVQAYLKMLIWDNMIHVSC